MSKKSNRFSPEVRERAVRMVRDHRGEYPDLAFKNTAASFGCVYTDTAYYQMWIKQIESHQLIRSVWVPGIRPEDCTKPLIRLIPTPKE